MDPPDASEEAMRDMVQGLMRDMMRDVTARVASTGAPPPSANSFKYPRLGANTTRSYERHG